MALTSYITEAEGALHFPSASEYSAAQRTEALETSFSMVNSFLNSTVNLPAIAEDGTIPGLLKVGQVRFYQWILESANQGWTEDGQALHDNNAEFLSKLTNNELLISELQDTARDIGWTLQATDVTDGYVYIKGYPPAVETELIFTVSSSGTKYIATDEVTFTVKRRDTEGTYATFTADYDWVQPIGTEYIELRFDGQFTADETFTVKGIPSTSDIASTNQVIKQSTLL